jgi:HlyD family secretion protein
MTMPNSGIKRRRGPSGWLIAVIVVLVLIGAVAGLIVNARAGRAAPLPATVKVTRGDLVAQVTGSGSVAAEQTVNLPFQATGTVTDVPVKEGDTVQAGQVLAKLDDRNLQLQVTSARAALDSAQARLAQAKSGNAKPEDLAVAQAQVASAQANLDKVTGGATGGDRASAQAAVQSAQAAYNAAVSAAGTTNSQLESAAATLQKAEAAVQQAQAAYDKVAGAPNIGMLPQSLQLQQATIDYQQAKANFDSLNKTSNTDAQAKVDSAAAQLAQARANLVKLNPTKEDVAAAQASLDSAKANLAKLTAPATDSDLMIQQAAVTQAQSQLQQAQLALDNATLKAPFGGVISNVNIVPGSLAGPTTPAMQLINRNPLHVDLRLSENDVALVRLNQPVQLTISSLAGWQTDGKVSYVAPAADNSNGIVTYAVRVSFADSDPQVKVGMTADLEIVTARKSNVLLVPSTALLPKGAGHAVQVVTTDAQGNPTVKETDVEVGLSDGVSTEITSGLKEGQSVVALPDNGVKRQPSGPFGG